MTPKHGGQTSSSLETQGFNAEGGGGGGNGSEKNKEKEEGGGGGEGKWEEEEALGSLSSQRFSQFNSINFLSRYV